MKTVYRGFCDRDPKELTNLVLKTSRNYSLGHGVYFAYDKSFAKYFQVLKTRFGFIGEYEIQLPPKTLIIYGSKDGHHSNDESYNKTHELYREDSVTHYKDLYAEYEKHEAVDHEGREVCLKTLDYGVELKSFSVSFVDPLAVELKSYMESGSVEDEYTLGDISPVKLELVLEFLKKKEIL